MPEPVAKKRAVSFRISLRLLFVLMIVVGLALAPIAARVRQASKQRIARTALDNHNWFVPLGGDLDLSSGTPKPIEEPRLPAWLIRSLGEDFFTDALYARSPQDDDQALPIDYGYVADLRGLRKLELYRATDADLSRIRDLPKVEWLVLEQCSITDKGLQQLAGYRQLRSLKIYETPITDGSLAQLAGLQNLTEITIRGARIKGDGLKHLASLSKLKELSVTQCQLSGVGLDSLTGLSQLTSLHLESNLLTDASVDSLLKFTQLKHLTIGHTEISDSGRARLGLALPDCYIGRHRSGR
jgi:Leucine-rich repeat (LRR) protein